MTKELQSDSIDLADDCSLFDILMKDYPTAKKYPSNDSKIVHSPDFKSGIIKIHVNQESNLSPNEKNAVECFEKAHSSTSKVYEEQVDCMSLASRARNRRRLASVSSSVYKI